MPQVHAGAVLLESFLKPLQLTPALLADRLGVPAERISRLVHGQEAMTVETAALLAGAFGTSPMFWLDLPARPIG